MLLLAVHVRPSFIRPLVAPAPRRLIPGFSALLRSSKCNFGSSCTISGPLEVPTAVLPASRVPIKQRKLPAQPRPWTPQEEEILREEVAKQLADANGRNGAISALRLPTRGPKSTIDWVRVAAQLPGRTRKGCRSKWYFRLKPNIRHEPWSPEEDRQLTALVHEALAKSLQENPSIDRSDSGTSGPVISWTWVARSMDNGRTFPQCRERWHTTLRDYIIVGDDVVVDDSVIVSEAGADGSESAFLPAGSRIVKRRTGRWTADEDRLLLKGIAAEPRRWTRIAERFVLTRMVRQCRVRWVSVLKKRNVA